MTWRPSNEGLDPVDRKVRAHPGVNRALDMIFGKSQAARLDDVNADFKTYLTPCG